MTKLASGNWRTQVYLGKDENGKPIRVSVTAPTKDICEWKASVIKKEHKKKLKTGLTVGKCIDQYIALSAAVLSPTTIQGYRKARRTSFQSIMNTPVTKLSDAVMQEAINEECGRITRSGRPMSAKTVQNNYGVIATAVKEISGFTFKVKLPKKVRSIKEYPDPSEVMKRIKGTDIELPCLLAMWLSFTMSEIRGLMCSSVRDGVIYIEEVVVDGAHRNIRKEQAKTSMRRRKHVLPPYIMELINTSTPYKNYALQGENKPLIGIRRDNIYRRFKKYTDGLGITFHDLRHLNASVMAQLNIPSKYAQERGGWSSPRVYETVYQHTFSKARRDVDEVINDYFEEMLSLI